nr:MAG TPA: hypothetical protein [Inoviridae sp.]
MLAVLSWFSQPPAGHSRISLSALSAKPASGFDSSLRGIPTFCHFPARDGL